MSMLTRKGTLVRKHRQPLRKQSVRRTRSAGSTSSTAGQRTTEEEESSVPPSPVAKLEPSVPPSPVAKLEPSVPPSPVAKLEPRLSTRSLPSRSLVATVVSYDDQKHLFGSSAVWGQWGQGHSVSSQWGQGHSVSSQWGHSGSVDTGLGQPDSCLPLQELAKDTDSTCHFLCRVSKVLCSTDVMSVLLAVSMIIPVAMVTMGVKFLGHCPLEPRVPVYLLVGGCVLMLKLTLCLWRAFQRRRHDSADASYDEHDVEAGLSSRTSRFMDGVLTLFLLGWHVAGSYWLFSIWRPRFSPLLHSPSHWCDRSVYLFSVGVSVALDLLAGLYLALLCCLGIVYRPPGQD